MILLGQPGSKEPKGKTMMNITATTTKAQIIAPVLEARTALAKYAAKVAKDSDQNPETFFVAGEALLLLAQKVRSKEVLMRNQLSYLSIIGRSVSSRMTFLMEIATQGADDTWSGRKNEANRSAHDLVLSWVEDQMREVLYEAGI